MQAPLTNVAAASLVYLPFLAQDLPDHAQISGDLGGRFSLPQARPMASARKLSTVNCLFHGRNDGHLHWWG